MVIVIVCLLFALQLVNLHYERRESGSMSASIISKHYPTWKLTLPAVSFCPNTIVVADKIRPYITSQKRIYIPRGLTYKDFEHAMKYLRELIFPTNHFAEELDKLQQILTANRMSVLDLLDHVGPNCSDFVTSCWFEEVAVPCETLVEPVVTPYGICCSFNYENNDETRRLDNVMKKQESVNFGTHHVMSFLMKSEPKKNRVSSILYGDGVRVLIHEQHSYPGFTSQEFIAPVGHETEARLYGNYLTSSREVLKLSPEVSSCFSSQATYRAANCQTKCHESTIDKLCGCVPFYAATIENGGQMCNLSHISCLAHYRFQMESLQSHYEQCLCYPECESTHYNIEFTSLPLNAAQYYPGKFYRAALQVSDATVVHITFAGQTAVLERRELLLSTINVISSLGGIFGLFLGCSFISIFEIVFFLVSGFCQKLRKSQSTVFNVHTEFNESAE